MGDIEMLGYVNPSLTTDESPAARANHHASTTQMAELELAAFRRWQDRIVDAIGANSLDQLKQCYTPPWSLAGQLDRVPVESRLVPPLADAVLKGRSHLAIVKYLMAECSQRLILPHEASCYCQSCVALKEDATVRNQYVRRTLAALTSPVYVFSRPSDEDVIQFCVNVRQRLMSFQATFQPQCDRDAGNGLLASWSLSHQLFRPCVQATDYEIKYDGLRKAMQAVDQIVVLMLDQCRSDEETASLLTTNTIDQSEFVSFSRLTRKNLRLYRFAKLGMHESLVHPASQSILHRLWMHQWLKPDHLFSRKTSVNNPVFDGCCVGLGAPLFSLLMLITYFITIPIMFVLPHPALTFFVKNPRSKYYLSLIGEVLFQVLLYTYIYSTPLLPYRSLVERFCQPSHFYGFASSQYLGLSIILFIMLVAKVTQIAVRLGETAGRHVSAVGRNMLFWVEQASYSMLLAGFALNFVWMSNTDYAIQRMSTAYRYCFCDNGGRKITPFCRASEFSCLGAAQTDFSNQISELLYVSQISDVIISSASLANLIAVPSILASWHPWMCTLAARINAVLGIAAHVMVLFSVITIVIAGLILFVTANLIECTDRLVPMENFAFYPFGTALWELLWSGFLMSDRAAGKKPLALPNSVGVQKLFKLSTDMAQLLHYTYLLMIPFLLFAVTKALLVQVMGRQSKENFMEWVVCRSKVQLYHLCRGSELPIPYNLLHPVFSLTSFLMRKIFEETETEPAAHGGISQNGPLDSIAHLQTPEYRLTQDRCRDRIKANILRDDKTTDLTQF